MFEIPVDQYKKDIDSLLSKEKKKEIQDLLTHSNQLRSKEEFEEIKHELHFGCKTGDVELIQIYLSETIENHTKDMTFKIDRTKKTASLFKVCDICHLVVPRTFQYESTEYLITSITGTSRDIKSVSFEEDSAVNTIFFGAFSGSKIEKIYFPSSLRELRKGWCISICKLTNIKISPSNGQFTFKENKYLLGKTDPNIDEFDNLLFVVRKIKEFSIPSNIKIISSYALADSDIKKISIPSKVSIICEGAFAGCEDLKKVEIPPNSNLQTIGSIAFIGSEIEEIYFPTSLRELKDGWSGYAKELTKIVFSPSNDQLILREDKYLLSKTDPNIDEFDKLLFVVRDIKKMSIPSNIKIISSYAFSYSTIEEISIPSKVSAICEYAFYNCLNLEKVEISPNSDLQTIEFSAFSRTDIKEICIPSKVSIICENAFYGCNNLMKVEILPDSNLQIIGSNAFSYSNIEEIFIPSKVSTICENAFFGCDNLVKVKILPDSNLQIIEKHAFSNSIFKGIFIPSKVSTICENAFFRCQNLQIIEVAEESGLKLISMSTFTDCSEFIIMAPPPSLRK